MYGRYCQDVSSKRVPEADFVEELLKGLALLSINPKHSQSGGNALLKGITWAKVSCNHPQILNLSLQCHYTVFTMPLHLRYTLLPPSSTLSLYCSATAFAVSMPALLLECIPTLLSVLFEILSGKVGKVATAGQ